MFLHFTPSLLIGALSLRMNEELLLSGAETDQC